MSAPVVVAGVPSTSRKSAASGSGAPELAESGISALSESEPGGVVDDMTTTGGNRTDERTDGDPTAEGAGYQDSQRLGDV